MLREIQTTIKGTTYIINEWNIYDATISTFEVDEKNKYSEVKYIMNYCASGNLFFIDKKTKERKCIKNISEFNEHFRRRGAAMAEVLNFVLEERNKAFLEEETSEEEPQKS